MDKFLCISGMMKEVVQAKGHHAAAAVQPLALVGSKGSTPRSQGCSKDARTVQHNDHQTPLQYSMGACDLCNCPCPISLHDLSTASTLMQPPDALLPILVCVTHSTLLAAYS